MNKEYYIVLHGAKKNVGDFLIRDRAKKLLSFIREDRNLIEYPSWKSLDNNLEEVNNSKAIIIMGGPGISSNVYPNVFPLATNLDDIKVPIILLGTGSYVYPLSYIYKYKLSDDSKKFINKCKFVSVRDNTTKNILLSNGIKNVVMTVLTYFLLMRVYTCAICAGFAVRILRTRASVITNRIVGCFARGCTE